MTDEKNRPQGSTDGTPKRRSAGGLAVLSPFWFARFAWFASFFSVFAPSSPAAAAQKNATGAASVKDAAAALPPPKVALTVSTVSSKRWTMRLENTGDVPVRIVADPYLLSLEIMVPAGEGAAAKKPAKAREVRCVLPADMRPSTDSARNLVLNPGKAYSESFDPRMYCFGAKESAGLVRGARIIPHYGFASLTRPKRAASKPKAPTPPFVVAPIPDTDPTARPTLAPVNEIIGGTAIELSGDAVAGTSSTDNTTKDAVATRTTAPVSGASTAENDTSEPGLSIALPARTDGARASDMNLRVTLTNIGPRRAAIYFRPQSVAFDVTGPGGEFACSAGGAAAIRELFTTLAPRGRASLSVLAGSSCPDHSFDIPGLYEVRPRLDTRHIVGSPAAVAGSPPFEGEVMGTPALVRIRVGKQGILRPPPIIE
ncbi:hypothetical protein [Pendulispora albinea]|uniref:Uncharacterized protein n=1 Tax=Pendulispora albinea TaxID=2741071 RepID=A0ABZ2M2A7_9BACT